MIRLALLAAALFPASAAAQAAPALELPVACEVGRSCFVQNHFDHDPGPGVRDWRGGSSTYDGHDGVDFRLPSIAAQRAGVAVRAAAGGKVKAVRDGEPDRSIRAAPAAKGRECGNGVLLTHPGGWETQYCHMAQGSVAVRPGQAVAAGTVLGRIGLSGQTEFPHLHLGVRRDGVEVDPFAWSGRGLWSPAAAVALPYRSPQVIGFGFAAAPPTGAQLDEGEPLPRPSASGPALVVHVRAIGLRTGDVQTLTLLAPDGSKAAESVIPPLDRPKAQYFAFVGKRNSAGRLRAGVWRGRYVVRRGGAVVLDEQVRLTL